MPLPKVNESLVLVDFEAESVQELRAGEEDGEDPIYDEMLTMAKDEFQGHIDNLKKMQKLSDPADWKNWPPYKVLHSIKGLARTLGMERLGRYAESIERLKETIAQGDLEEIIETVEKVFAETMEAIKQHESPS
mmetsp:Transcript_2789/g.7216  ORF Transcript_2789/g.7216 Transcript_2789/m.7216 type:complete len:134 (-) Transcript_2789:715-1116(-)